MYARVVEASVPVWAVHQSWSAEVSEGPDLVARRSLRVVEALGLGWAVEWALASGWVLVVLD